MSVKVLRGEHDANSDKLYVKSVIKKSYGETTRKCFIQFDSENIPEKSHCECPVGPSRQWNMLLHFGILTFFKTF